MIRGKKTIDNVTDRYLNTLRKSLTGHIKNIHGKIYYNVNFSYTLDSL